MKFETLLLGALAGCTIAQTDAGNSTDEPLVAADQCTTAVLDACPADGTAAHRCLAVPNEDK